MPSEQNLSEQAQRHLPMVRSIAESIRRQLKLDIDAAHLIEKGSEALEHAVKTFRRGHSISFRTYAHYHITLAMYQSLRQTQWPSQETCNTYRFFQMSDELLQWHSQSAESMLKRTLDAETAEVKRVFRALVSAAVLVWKPDERMLKALPEKEERLLRLCFLQDLPVPEAALKVGVAKDPAVRLMFQALQNVGAEAGNSPGKESILTDETPRKENNND